MKTLTFKKWLYINVGLLGLVFIIILLALDTGAKSIDLFSTLPNLQHVDFLILLKYRLPRILLAMLVGIALASAGGAYQSLLRNPLADPYILGVSGGAALGSVLAVGLKLPFILVSLIAFGAAFLAMFLIFAIAKTKGRLPSHTLLLTGVIFNAFCFALILFVNALVTMEQAYQIVFLLIGNLEAVSYQALLVVAGLVLSGFFILVLFSGKMNVLSLGDEQASQLGINAYHLRLIIFFASSLMVGAAVAVAGLIGFVGLFVPHVVRLILGSDHRLLIPVSGILGGAFLIICDTLARSLLINTTLNTELPVGVITALIGAPFFVYLLKRQQKSL
ncbi:MAG: iron chelate uptake ABC transporter family permease subunit [Pseudomonadota bacterium]